MRSPSPPARAVLAFLSEPGREWSHGYDLVRATGVKSGTVYPLLIRLEAQGHLEAQWQPPAAPGRPPRHAYRLTASGLALAQRATAQDDGAALAFALGCLWGGCRERALERIFPLLEGPETMTTIPLSAPRHPRNIA